jgi:hypothetical protein
VICFECGATDNLHNHHVVPRSLGGTKTIPLCERCHGLVHEKDLRIAALTSRSLQHKRSRGELVGGVPYGFRVAADGVALEADAGEQEVITVARELVCGRRGLSLNKAATELTARGYAPRSGGQWYPQQVKRMVAASEVNP